MAPTPAGAAGSTPPADIEITDDAVRAFASAIDPDEDPFENYPEDAAIARVGLQYAAPHIIAASQRARGNMDAALRVLGDHLAAGLVAGPGGYGSSHVAETLTARRHQAILDIVAAYTGQARS